MSSKGSKQYYLLYVLIAVLLGTAVGFMMLGVSEQGNDITGLTIYDSRYTEILEVAKTDSNKAWQMCDDSFDYDLEETCYRAIAVSLKDYSLCDRFVSSKAKACYNLIAWDYIQQAKDTKQERYCDMIKTYGNNEEERKAYEYANNDKYDCYEGLASAANNYLLCSYIDDSHVDNRDDCYSAFVENGVANKKLCDEVNNKEKQDKCYRLAAVSINSIEVCDNIRSEEYRSYCYTDLYACYEITIPALKQRCIDLAGKAGERIRVRTAEAPKEEEAEQTEELPAEPETQLPEEKPEEEAMQEPAQEEPSTSLQTEEEKADYSVFFKVFGAVILLGMIYLLYVRIKGVESTVKKQEIKPQRKKGKYMP